MNEKLKRLAEQYAISKKRIIDLEGETAHSALTAQTFKDIRNTLDHVLTGITHESSGNEADAEYHYTQSAEHHREYILNSYEVVAGKTLTDAWAKIEDAKLFTQVSKAKTLHAEAVKQYSAGRNIRADNLEVGVAHFYHTTKLAREAGLEVVEVTKGEKFILFLSVVLGIIAIVEFLILVLK